MPPIATETITAALPAALNLKATKEVEHVKDDEYKYKWALPYANKDVKLPPLEPFEQ